MHNYVLTANSRDRNISTLAAEEHKKEMFRLNPVQTTNKHISYSNQSTEVGSRCGVLGNSLNLKKVDDCPTQLFGRELRCAEISL